MFKLLNAIKVLYKVLSAIKDLKVNDNGDIYVEFRGTLITKTNKDRINVTDGVDLRSSFLSTDNPEINVCEILGIAPLENSEKLIVAEEEQFQKLQKLIDGVKNTEVTPNGELNNKTIKDCECCK